MPTSLEHPDRFADRHIGPDEQEIREMLGVVGAKSVDELIDQTIPSSIRLRRPLDLPAAKTEQELLDLARAIASKNEVWRSLLGMGYSDCITPAVIQRNVLENPGWYTAYTPYQAEVSQGRLEALLNFQTMVTDLTALPVANASLLDEATAAAEAMHMMDSFKGAENRRGLFVSDECHPQTIDVVKTRAAAHGIDVIVGDARSIDPSRGLFGVLLQYPATDGALEDWRGLIERAHAAGALVTMACDLLALTMIVPPGELGADIAVGSAQRFGVPLGYGGPHAAFFACKSELLRRLPGRIIGVSVDSHGKPALRMALQTREQHIRREKATSNVCTAQALLAIVASMYAVYHGPHGLRAIAERVHAITAALALGLRRLGVRTVHAHFFDTLRVEGEPAEVAEWLQRARERKINLRRIDERSLGIALDETTSPADADAVLAIFAFVKGQSDEDPTSSDETATCEALAKEASRAVGGFERRSPFLTHPVFHAHHSETKMLRYLRTLESRDISLVHSMIPLGSCTMKLNATAEMMPITWSRFSRIHPFVPSDQALGYQTVVRQLEAMLSAITGFPAISLQPNSGAQGELAGLLVVRKYHESRGEGRRDVCLIPASAHGTNPASAAMAGMRVVVVACDEKGYVDLVDLEAKAREHADSLGALMVTYPSTYGVFEEEIERICAIVHEHGGQVYLDGANLNAQVGLCRPADVGADVCHVNLHKTFCIPHGGGGPGMGPIGVATHLARFLPGHPVVPIGDASSPAGDKADRVGAVSAAPWGSASILLISWAYISMMGPDGLKRATEVAILNANFIADRLHPHFPVFYRGKRGRVAHECILDTRGVKRTAAVDVEDIAKRLIDYGFHAPTMSFPIAGTLMIEPTESESKGEIDRLCSALIAIRGEIRAVEEGRLPREDNPLKNAPHTAEAIASSEWSHPYTREQAVFPAAWTRARKFWPSVGRINNAQGDRNLICTCPPVEAYAS